MADDPHRVARAALDLLRPQLALYASEAVRRALAERGHASLQLTGTVQSYSASTRTALVTVDGDTDATGFQNITGSPLVTDQRVVVEFVPPHGAFVTGFAHIHQGLDLIERQTLTVAGTPTFTIPTGYQSLRIEYSARVNAGGATSDTLLLRFNNDATVGAYTSERLLGAGAAASAAPNAAGVTSAAECGVVAGSGSTAGRVGSGVIEIPEYSGTTWHKTLVATTGLQVSGLSLVGVYSGLWGNPAAVTSIGFTNAGGQPFAIGSTWTVYGVT